MKSEAFRFEKSFGHSPKASKRLFNILRLRLMPPTPYFGMKRKSKSEKRIISQTVDFGGVRSIVYGGNLWPSLVVTIVRCRTLFLLILFVFDVSSFVYLLVRLQSYSPNKLCLKGFLAD